MGADNMSTNENDMGFFENMSLNNTSTSQDKPFENLKCLLDGFTSLLCAVFNYLQESVITFFLFEDF